MRTVSGGVKVCVNDGVPTALLHEFINVHNRPDHGPVWPNAGLPAFKSGAIEKSGARTCSVARLKLSSILSSFEYLTINVQ